MKNKILIFLVIILNLSCNNETKKNQSLKEVDENAKKEEVLKNIVLPNYSFWKLGRLTLEETIDNLKYHDEQVFILSRTSTTETAYALVDNIKAEYGGKYKVSVIVKKASLGNLFGLRIIGEYPNRVDAVFDLKSGLMKEVVEVGDFFNGDAFIEDMDEGWFKCTLKAEVNAEKIKIIFGPTFGLGKTITWEAPTAEKCNNYIIPSSLTLEQIAN